MYIYRLLGIAGRDFTQDVAVGYRTQTPLPGSVQDVSICSHNCYSDTNTAGTDPPLYQWLT